VAGRCADSEDGHDPEDGDAQSGFDEDLAPESLAQRAGCRSARGGGRQQPGLDDAEIEGRHADQQPEESDLHAQPAPVGRTDERRHRGYLRTGRVGSGEAERRDRAQPQSGEPCRHGGRDPSARGCREGRRPPQAEGEGNQRAQPRPRRQEMERVQSDRPEGGPGGRGGVAGGGDEAEADRGEDEHFAADGHPVGAGLVTVAEDEEQAREDKEGLADEPHGPVAGLPEDRRDRRPVQAGEEAEPAGHRRLTCEVERTRAHREDERPPGEAEQALVEGGEPGSGVRVSLLGRGKPDENQKDQHAHDGDHAPEQE